MGLHFVSTIRVQRRRSRLYGIDYFIANGGLGLHEWTTYAASSDDAVGFLVDLLLNDPNLILASSVEIVHLASN